MADLLRDQIRIISLAHLTSFSKAAPPSHISKPITLQVNTMGRSNRVTDPHGNSTLPLLSRTQCVCVMKVTGINAMRTVTQTNRVDPMHTTHSSQTKIKLFGSLEHGNFQTF